MKEKIMSKLTRKFILLTIIIILLITGTAFAFKDVAISAWYYEAVTRLSELGIMNGKGDGNFDPNETITRAEMAAIMVNTIDYIEKSHDENVAESISVIVSTLQYAGYIISGTNHGSGVMIDDSGLMLTAYHVVDEVDSLGIRVSLTGSTREYNAEVVYTMPEYDLALIQIFGAGARNAIKISDNSVKILDKIYAIGNPFGLSNSITSGYVSRLDSKVGGNGISHIQMDISINSGNSGGAIVNSNGELVGIALSTISPKDGSGIGFAVGLKEINEIIEKYKNQ